MINDQIDEITHSINEAKFSRGGENWSIKQMEEIQKKV